MSADHERGRMTEQLRNLTLAVQGLQHTVGDMTRNFATVKDLDRVETVANGAKQSADKANTRLDSFSTWEKIGAAILIAAVVYSMKLG